MADREVNGRALCRRHLPPEVLDAEASASARYRAELNAEANQAHEQFMDRLLAERPVNGNGDPVCDCGVPLEPRAFQCGPCLEAAKQREITEARERRLEDWRNSVRLTLTGFPAWSWARVDSAEFANATRKSPRFARVAREYSPVRGNVALLGVSGGGKTAATVAAAHRMADAVIAFGPHRGWQDLPEWAFIAGPGGRWCRTNAMFCRAAELARASREHPLGEGLAPLVESAMCASWAVVDDLGNEAPGGESLLLEILDERYSHQRVTWITSGMRRAEIEKRYGSAFLRRLAEPVGAIVECWGEGG